LIPDDLHCSSKKDLKNFQSMRKKKMKQPLMIRQKAEKEEVENEG
jgi:hypothetical protein